MKLLNGELCCRSTALTSPPRSTKVASVSSFALKIMNDPLVLSVAAVAVGLDSIILNRNLDSHRTLTRVFFANLRRQSRNAADDKHKLREQRREPEVMKNGGQGPIHINRKRLDQVSRDGLDCRKELNPSARDSGGTRQPEQERRSWILQVDPVAESG